MRNYLFSARNKAASLILYVIFAALIVIWLAVFTGLNQILVLPLVRSEPAVSADVIVVLGAGLDMDTKTLPLEAVFRVKKADLLYEQQKLADFILLSGGQVKHSPYAESDFMEDLLVFLGVPKNAIIKERDSTSTYENAVYSRSLLNSLEVKRIALVTSAFHTARACRVFEKAGYQVECLAAFPDSNVRTDYFFRLTEFISIVREYLAIVYYKLLGYI